MRQLGGDQPTRAAYWGGLSNHSRTSDCSGPRLCALLCLTLPPSPAGVRFSEGVDGRGCTIPVKLACRKAEDVVQFFIVRSRLWRHSVPRLAGKSPGVYLEASNSDRRLWLRIWRRAVNWRSGKPSLWVLTPSTGATNPVHRMPVEPQASSVVSNLNSMQADRATKPFPGSRIASTVLGTEPDCFGAGRLLEVSDHRGRRLLRTVRQGRPLPRAGV